MDRARKKQYSVQDALNIISANDSESNYDSSGESGESDGENNPFNAMPLHDAVDSRVRHI